MSHIAFRVSAQELGAGAAVTIVPCVDGVPLPDLVRDAGLPPARRRRRRGPAGRYAGLKRDEVGWPSRHYLGEPALSWFGDGDTVLLGCTCGDWGCSPFTATVTVRETVVCWSRFRTRRREWDHRKLPVLTFDRAQYERALRATRR
ncbi:MAG TPA: hypothetical protein VFY17_01720 [Pilimelia sp.]|nr:hypothetical protein [Pilimelia sp.]